MTSTVPATLQEMPPPLSFCFYSCSVSDFIQYNVRKAEFWIRFISNLFYGYAYWYTSL